MVNEDVQEKELQSLKMRAQEVLELAGFESSLVEIVRGTDNIGFIRLNIWEEEN